MDQGRIAQAGPAPEIYTRPRNAYVARFMGGHNVLNGTVTAVTHGMATLVTTSGERYATLLSTQTVMVDDTVWCSIRRDRITVTKAPLCGAPMPAEPNAIGGTIQAIEYQGAYVKVTMQRPRHEDCVAHMADSDFFTQSLDIGDQVVARWAAEDVHLLETEGDLKRAQAVVGQPYEQACDAPAM
jgi:putative spermidine/putrescine transport system ATP-binding protein